MNRGECLMSLYFSVKDDSLRIITPSLPAYGLTMIQHNSMEVLKWLGTLENLPFE